MLDVLFLLCAVYVVITSVVREFIEWSVERMKNGFNTVLMVALLGMFIGGARSALDWHQQNVAETAALHAQADAIEARVTSFIEQSEKKQTRALTLLEWAASAYAEQCGAEVPMEHK